MSEANGFKCDVCGKFETSPSLPFGWHEVTISASSPEDTPEHAQVCSGDCASKWLVKIWKAINDE
jgi:hypothetical protein